MWCKQVLARCDHARDSSVRVCARVCCSVEPSAAGSIAHPALRAGGDRRRSHLCHSGGHQRAAVLGFQLVRARAARCAEGAPAATAAVAGRRRNGEINVPSGVTGWRMVLGRSVRTSMEMGCDVVQTDARTV